MDSPLLPNHSNPVPGASKHASDGLFRGHWRGELASVGKNKTYTARSAETKNDFKHEHMKGKACIGEDSARSAEKKTVFLVPNLLENPQTWNLGRISIILAISSIGRDSQIEGFKTY